jgi:hypothetical protein
VPNDGKFFFTNDVLRSAAENVTAGDQADPPARPAEAKP